MIKRFSLYSHQLLTAAESREKLANAYLALRPCHEYTVRIRLNAPEPGCGQNEEAAGRLESLPTRGSGGLAPHEGSGGRIRSPRGARIRSPRGGRMAAQRCHAPELLDEPRPYQPEPLLQRLDCHDSSQLDFVPSGLATRASCLVCLTNSLVPLSLPLLAEITFQPSQHAGLDS